MEPIDPDNPLAGIIEAMMGLIENFQPFTEACIGYKSQLVDAGYSEENAERIATELHIELIHRATRGR